MVYGVYVEQATNVEVDDLKVIADSKINYGGKPFGIDDLYFYMRNGFCGSFILMKSELNSGVIRYHYFCPV